jgi:hypothetical protein
VAHDDVPEQSIVKTLVLGIGLLALGVAAAGAQAPAVLDNDHVRVTRNGAPCASHRTAGCGDRVIVALETMSVLAPGAITHMRRGDILVFSAGKSFTRPSGEFLEVAVKPDRPPVKSPPVIIPPDKNSILYDGENFFVFEEKLDPGDTRARHSHRERVVIVINKTRLQQWPDDAPMLFRDQIPDDVRFNPPVVHVVKTVGDQPLRNIVIEFKR